MTKNDIIAALSSLTHAELRDVRASLTMLMSSKAQDMRDGPLHDTFEHMVLRSIVDAVKPYAGVSLGQLKNAPSYPAFKDKLDDQEAFFKGAGCDAQQTQLLVGLALRFMLDYWSSNGRLITGMSIMGNVHNLKAYINWKFPGYAKAGMLSAIKHYGLGEDRND